VRSISVAEANASDADASMEAMSLGYVEPMSELLIHGGMVFDGTGRPPFPADVRVAGERIAAIGPHGSLDGSVATRIDASGMTVIPGLIDAHIHIARDAEHDGPLYLSAGVTSARDTGGSLERLGEIRARQRDGSWSGPRLVYAGPLIDGEPPVWPRAMTSVVTTEAEAAEAVERHAAAGVDLLKVYSGVDLPLLRAVIARAREHGLPVIGDLSRTSASDAIAAGIDGLEHASVAYDDIVPRELRVPMTLFHEQGPAVWRREWNKGLAAADAHGPVARGLARQMAESGVWFDPTLVVLERLARLTDPEVTEAPEVALATDAQRGTWKERSLGRERVFTPDDHASAVRAFETCVAFVGEAIGAGATILVGSDAPNPYVVPGWSLHRELELLVRAGLAPANALSKVTRGNAEALGLADLVGTIEPGKVADIVVVAGDPTRDIRETRNVRHVLQGGTARKDVPAWISA
jgi:imidazolonepropionase-like amidohydrolase